MKMVRVYKKGDSILAPEPDLDYYARHGWTTEPPKAKKPARKETD